MSIACGSGVLQRAPFSPQQEIRRFSANCHRLHFEKIGLQVCQFFWDQPPGELFLPIPAWSWYTWWMWSGRPCCTQVPDSLSSDQVLVKLDFTNAFYSLHRREMLLLVHSRIPELYAYCQSAYSTDARLACFSTHTLFCLRRGPVVGDLPQTVQYMGRKTGKTCASIGALLFGNSINPTLSSLKSCLNLRYLDDITLCGSAKTVATDIREIIRAGAAIGLSLNVDKCELITHPGERWPPSVVQDGGAWGSYTSRRATIWWCGPWLDVGQPLRRPR